MSQRTSLPSIKLNLGSGPTGAVNWTNYEWGLLPLLSKFPHIREFLVRIRILPSHYDVPWPKIQLVDIRRPWPLPDNCVQYIYTSQVLEHFERWESLKILRESFRVLMPNGSIRIVVPDLSLMCREYLEQNQFYLSPNPTHQPDRDFCHLLFGYNKDIEPQSFMERVRRRFIREHKWHYDQQGLSLLLREAGFSRVHFCEFRKGSIPDLQLLDLEIHRPHSMYVESSK